MSATAHTEETMREKKRVVARRLLDKFREEPFSTTFDLTVYLVTRTLVGLLSGDAKEVRR